MGSEDIAEVVRNVVVDLGLESKVTITINCLSGFCTNTYDWEEVEVKAHNGAVNSIIVTEDNEYTKEGIEKIMYSWVLHELK